VICFQTLFFLILITTETKVITGKNTDTIIDRINEASEQAYGILLNITSNISGLKAANAIKGAIKNRKNIENIYVNIRGQGFYFDRRQVLGKTMIDRLSKIK